MDASDLVGTWKLVANRHWAADGTRLAAQFGPEPMGLLRFLANGRMMVVIADSRVTLPADVARRPFSGYTGNWTLDGKTLSTMIDESFLPYAGTVQSRELDYVHGRLSLVPPPMTVDGVTHYRDLVWEKIA